MDSQEKALSGSKQSVLSRNKCPDADHADHVNAAIREFLEATNGVILGNIKIVGQVADSIPEDIEIDFNRVASGCGYCMSDECHVFPGLDCLLCQDFITTPAYLSYFQERVKMLDKKIVKASIPHDKEDLVAIKRLYLRYIEAILNKQERNLSVS